MAIKFANEIITIAKRFRKEIQYCLGDQIRKASLSICNNIAEGSGKNSKAAKQQFYSYALDSARECIPMITISQMQKEIRDEEVDHLSEECITICKMLAKLIASV